MDSHCHKIVWRSYQESLERKGVLLLLVGLAAMLLLACIAEYHHPQPETEAEYYSHKGLMDRIWHLRIPLWAGVEGIRTYLPYEYVFYVGMMVLGIGITMVVMGAMPDPEVRNVPETDRWVGTAHDC